MSFGNNLRKLIEERDMTQKELAKQLNIAPSTLGSYVQNAREPDFATLILLADFFDVSTELNPRPKAHPPKHLPSQSLF